MKFFVVAPVSAFFMLVLLLLMVQLAGLNISQISTKPLLLSESVFDLNTVSFAAKSEEQFADDSAHSLVPVELLKTAPLPELAFEEPVLTESYDALVSEEIDLPAPDLSVTLNITLPDNLLDGVVIAQKKRNRKPKSIAKVIKKVAQPTKKPQVLRASKAVSSVAVNKNSTQSSQTNKVASRAASPISKVKPKYPSRARRRGIEGEVTVSFVVNKTGSVDKGSIRVIAAKPAKIFNKAVYLAVAKWRFSPNLRPYRTKQRLVFSLKNT